MLKINTDFYRCFYICMDSFLCLPGRDLSWGSDHVVPSWIFMPPDILCLGNPSINSLIPSFIHLLICLFFLCVISMWYLQFIGTYSTKISYEDQSKWNGGNGGFTFYSLEIRSRSQSQVMRYVNSNILCFISYGDLFLNKRSIKTVGECVV